MEKGLRKGMEKGEGEGRGREVGEGGDGGATHYIPTVISRRVRRTNTCNTLLENGSRLSTVRHS